MSRSAGILAAAFIAAVVFGAGMALLPPVGEIPPAEPAPPAPPPAPPAPAPSPEPSSDALARAADAAAGGGEGTADAGAAADAAAAAGALPGGRRGLEKTADKDVAREAWRKNLPDISVDGAKASILIPIRGSIEGAAYHITNKPRNVIVNLPSGESMITMRFYKIRREGFRQVWIKQEEGQGTTLRIVLEEGAEPQVEIKEDFVRVIIRRPSESAPASETAAPPAAAQPEAQ